jgi:hypothetical protein
MTPAIVSALTSLIALGGVALGAWLNGHNTGRQWTRDAQLRACQRLMDQYAAACAELARTREDVIPDVAWAPWNQALTEVSFVCDKPVVDAAYAIDETFWRVESAIEDGQRSPEAWIPLRHQMESARDAFIRAVRLQTNARFRDPVRTSGRPVDDDPMWTGRSPQTS